LISSPVLTTLSLCVLFHAFIPSFDNTFSVCTVFMLSSPVLTNLRCSSIHPFWGTLLRITLIFDSLWLSYNSNIWLFVIIVVGRQVQHTHTHSLSLSLLFSCWLLTSSPVLTKLRCNSIHPFLATLLRITLVFDSLWLR
jgi:hypothetical protein